MLMEWLQRAISPSTYTTLFPKPSRFYEEAITRPENPFKRRSLKYGVELEYVLAFHELELDLTDDGGGPNHGIEKMVPLAVRREESWSPAVTGHLDRSSSILYNSWGILQNNAKDDSNMKHMANMRPYHLEPQSIVLRKLNEKASLVRNKVTHRREQRMTDKVDGAYDEWIVSTDRTVVGRGSANLSKWLPRLDSSHTSKRWDSYGIEVISRVLSSNSIRDRAELEQVVNALKGRGDELYEGFITNQCALQVHVQAPSLEALKELAVILLIYEEEISRLHPKCRRPGHRVARSNIVSNRMLTFLTPNFIPFLGNLQRVWDEPTETYLFRRLRTIQQIRDEIGQLHDEKKLAEYMCFPGTQRTRVVNFRHLRSSAHPQTIEFRQARGSLEIDDVTHWVDFCLGLVQLAEYYVHNPDAKIKNWDENTNEHKKKLDIFQLLEELQLNRRSMKYWRSRVAKYMTGDDEDERSDIEDIPSEKKCKTPSKTLGGLGGPPGTPGAPPPPPPPPPPPLVGLKVKPPLPPPLPKTPPTKKSIFPPVPPLHSPTAVEPPPKAPVPPGKPELSRSQMRLLNALEQSQAKLGIDKPFFDVDADEGSTIPPLPPALSPDKLGKMSNLTSSILDSAFLGSLQLKIPKPATTDSPDKKKSGDFFYKKPKPKPKPKPKTPDISDQAAPEDFYRNHGSASDISKAERITDTAGHPKFQFPGAVSNSSEKSGEEPPDDWEDKEFDTDEEIESGIFSGNFGVDSFYPQKETPTVEYPELPPVEENEEDFHLFGTQAPGKTGWDDEHEDEDSDTEVYPHFLQGGSSSAQSVPAPLRGTSSNSQDTSSATSLDDENMSDYDMGAGAASISGSQAPGGTGWDDEGEDEGSNTEVDPHFLQGFPHVKPKAAINANSSKGKTIFTVHDKSALEDVSMPDDWVSPGRIPVTTAPIDLWSFFDVPATGTSDSLAGDKRKRPEDDLPDADTKDAKKQRITPKKRAPTHLGPMPIGVYNIEEIIELLKTWNSLSKEDFEERVTELYFTTPENMDIVSQAISEHAKHHRVLLPDHVPGHSLPGDKTMVKKIQDEWGGGDVADTSANAALARAMDEHDMDPDLAADHAFAIQLLKDEESELTLAAGSENVGQELKFHHPPLTKFGLEKLDQLHPGTPQARLRIKNFNMREWETINTPVTISGRFGQCGAAAVVLALRQQYPQEPWTQGLTPEEFLAAWVSTVPFTGDKHRTKYFDEEQLDNAVQRLTNGELHIAVVHQGLETSGLDAESCLLPANGEPARYLYLHLTHAAFPQKRGVTPYQHWEAMKRKPGEKEHE